jgi:ATP-binding cassette subfamily B protein
MIRNRQLIRNIVTVLTRTIAIHTTALRSFPGYSAWVILSAIIAGLMPIAIPWVMKLLTDSAVAYLSSPSEMRFLRQVLYVLALYFAVEMARSLVSRYSSYILNSLAQSFSLRIQEEIYARCASMDYHFFEVPALRDVLYRAQTQSTASSNSLLTATSGLGRSCITVIGVAVTLYLFSPGLLITTLLLIAPSFILSARLGRQQYEIIRDRAQRVRKAGYMGGLLIERRYARDNILFGTWRHFRSLWETLQKETLAEDLKMHRQRTRLAGFAEALGSIAHCAAYLYVIWTTAQQAGTIGAVVMYVGLFDRVEDELKMTSDLVADIYRNTTFLDDYYNLKKMESKIEPQMEGMTLTGDIQSIEFERVAFQYPNSARFAANDLSFTIKAGECVCLVGCNGAGKSTIVKLMLRLFDPVSGRVLVNGRDLREYTPREIRKAFGVLMQDFSIYLTSVKDNVVIGDLEKPCQDKAFWKAIDCVGLRQKVKSLPHGEDTILGKIFGDGEDLSIGEWQALGLARVFFRDASVFVLDEPTSSLDAKMEETILEQFRERTRGKISVIVSHRFSSARIADKIIVVDSGRIAEIGTHAELMARDGLHARLFRIQRRRYVGDDLSEREEAESGVSLSGV